MEKQVIQFMLENTLTCFIDLYMNTEKYTKDEIYEKANKLLKKQH